MIQHNLKFADQEEMKSFVLDCESKYEAQVRNAAREICKNREERFIMLSGASCSGKTTTSFILEDEMKKFGKTAKIISIDDFYRSRDDISRDKIPNYEAASAIDLNYFVVCISDILAGKSTRLPKYDFQLGMRSGYTDYHPSENEFIVFEGIQAMYPEIMSLLPKKATRAVYIGVHDDVSAYGSVFKAREIRLFRRIVRDFFFRGASVSLTMKLWDGVARNEDENIFPNAKHADFFINTLMLYEINVIKPYVLDRKMYDFSSETEVELYKIFEEKFRNVPIIPSSLVPENSVFREFIGH